MNFGLYRAAVRCTLHGQSHAFIREYSRFCPSYVRKCQSKTCSEQKMYVYRHNKTYNVTFRRVRDIVVAVEKQSITHSLRSVSYPACKAHALCFIVTCVLYGSTRFFDIIS